MANLKKYSFLIFFLSILLFLLIVFKQVVHAPLFSTDDEMLIKIPQITKSLELQSILSILTPGTNVDYYPLRDLSYSIDHFLFGEKYDFYRIHQIILFALCAYFLCKLLYLKNQNISTAIFFTSLWALLPFHNETIVWLAARKDVLALLFGVMSLYYFEKYQKDESNHFKIILFYVASLLSKASFTLLPIYFVMKLGLNEVNKRKKFFIPLLSLMLAGSFGQSWFYSSITVMSDLNLSLTTRLEFSLAALGRIVLGIFNSSLNAIDYNNNLEWLSLNYSFLYVGVLIWVVLIAFFWFFRKKKNDILPELLLIILLYLPASGLLFPHKIFYSTRYFEGALIAILFIASAQVKEIKKIYWAIIPSFAVWALFAANNWNDPLVIRSHALEVTPENKTLQAWYLSDVINEKENMNRELRNELIIKLKKGCETSVHPDEACLAFYRIAFNIHRSNFNLEETKKYYQYLVQTLEGTGRGAFVENIDFDYQLSMGTFVSSFLVNYKKKNKAETTEESRIQGLIASCLIGSSSKEKYADYQRRNLIIQENVENYINRNVAQSLQKNIKQCFL